MDNRHVRARNLTLSACGIGLAVTLVIAGLPFVRFAYRAPEVHVALEIAEGLIALLTAYLIVGRVRERQLSRDVNLVYALLLFAFTNLLLTAIPSALLGKRASTFSTWAPLICRVIGVGAFAMAAFTPADRTERRRRTGFIIVGASLATLFLVALAVGVARDSLPVGINPALLPDLRRPALIGHPVLLGTQFLIMLLFALASLGFTREAERSGDSLLHWIGAGASLASFARLNYFLFPSIYTDFIYTGDLLRLGFYVSLLVGASSEIRAYWRRLESDIAERDRLNAELERLALTDPLTGLNNRRGFTTLADQQIKLASRTNLPFSLIFLDLNNMKGINDTFGHELGDQALHDTATLMQSSFRASDVLARLGGDEFCALVVSNASEAEQLVGRFQDLTEAHNDATGRSYGLSYSIGLAAFDPEKHVSINDLMREADQLMYEQKMGLRERPKVLLVDDDSDLLLLLRNQLQDSFDVSTAASGKECLDVGKQERPDLIVLDLRLPDCQGTDLIPQLRRELDDRIGILVLTGAADMGSEAETLKIGADDYLTKPFQEEVLHARLARLLARTRRR